MMAPMWSLALASLLSHASAPSATPAAVDVANAPRAAAPLPPVSPPPNTEPSSRTRRGARIKPIAGHFAAAYEGRTWSQERRWLSSVRLEGGLELGMGLTFNLAVAPTSPFTTTLQSQDAELTVGARLRQLPVTAEVGFLHRRRRIELEVAAAGGAIVQHLSTTSIPFNTEGATPLLVQGEWYSDGILGAHTGLRVRITPGFALRVRVGAEALVRGTAPVVRFSSAGATSATPIAKPERVRAVVSLGFSFRP